MPSNKTPSLIGQTIDNRYKVERKLGEGGMAEVYLASDERTGGRVALKAPWAGIRRHQSESVAALREKLPTCTRKHRV